MNDNLLIFSSILLMSFIVFSIRLLGFYIAGLFSINPVVKAWLDYLPGCLLISIIVPPIIDGDLSVWIASFSVLIIALKTKNLFVSVLVGVMVSVLFHFILK